MRMVQVATDQVVGVIAMGNDLVPAARSVPVSTIVLGARVLRSARRRVLRANCNRALLHLVALNPVQMALVQVVGMTFM